MDTISITPPAFARSISAFEGQGSQLEKHSGGEKVILLFQKDDTKTTQSTKRAHGD
jgi:hypothetical protein